MKIIYSEKNDELLVSNRNKYEDFAGNLWTPKDKFFKAIFGKVKSISYKKQKNRFNYKK